MTITLCKKQVLASLFRLTVEELELTEEEILDYIYIPENYLRDLLDDRLHNLSLETLFCLNQQLYHRTDIHTLDKKLKYVHFNDPSKFRTYLGQFLLVKQTKKRENAKNVA